MSLSPRCEESFAKHANRYMRQMASSDRFRLTNQRDDRDFGETQVVSDAREAVPQHVGHHAPERRVAEKRSLVSKPVGRILLDYSDLDDMLGDMMQETLSAIRYCVPSSDTNRARWSVDPLWSRVQQEVQSDLFIKWPATPPQAS